MSKPIKQKVKLQESDWAALFPTKSFVIGTTTITIAPLSIEELSSVLNKLALISDKIQEDLPETNLEDGVAKSSITILNLVNVIMENSPDILSDIANIEVDDIQSLPLDKALELFNFCLDVNIESQDSLVKNFAALGEKIQKFMGNQSQTPLTQIPLES